MNVLVIDDDAAIVQFVDWVLSDEGYEVATAANGASALQLLEHFQPDLILLDMRMPVMDGWQFARAYRDGRDAVAPIVVLTAAQDASKRAKEIEADDYLGKPFDVDELLAIVQRYESPRSNPSITNQSAPEG